MNIIITVPSAKKPRKMKGGVSNYFGLMRKYLSCNVEYYEIGALAENESIIAKLKNLIMTIIRLRSKLTQKHHKYNLIQLNPSFLYKALIRDGLLLKLSSRYCDKKVVFFRGLNDRVVDVIDRYFKTVFCYAFGKADAFIVLSSKFKEKLREWGFDQPIFLETTIIDDEIIKNFSIEKKIKRIQSKKEIQILFLARIEKDKGIFEVLDTFKILSDKYRNIKLAIAGDGSIAQEAQEYTKMIGLDNRVSFLGYVVENEKIEVYMQSDIYLLPTYREGMPNSILEAMAFGLPVITRPEGGIPDFFKNSKHGYLTKSRRPEVFAELVERIIIDKVKWQKMSNTVHNYAKERFLASKVSKRIDDIYKIIMNS